MRPTSRLSMAFNGIICGILGATFGIVLGNILPWLIGGLLAGVALDRTSILLFSKFGNRAWLNRHRLLLLALVEALFALYILVPTIAAFADVHPTRLPIAVTPTELGLSAEQVSLMTV